MSKFTKFLGIATAVAFSFGLFATDVSALSSSSSSSSSRSSPSVSSSSRSFGSSSYTKPSIPSSSSYTKPSTPSYTPPSSSSRGYTKPTTPSTSSSFGYTKPSATPTPSAVLPSKPATGSSWWSSSGSSYSKPGASSTTTAPKVVAPSTLLSTSSAKRTSSSTLDQYRAERAKAKTPPTPVDVTATRNDSTFTRAKSQYRSVDDYWTRRREDSTRYYNSHPDTVFYTRNLAPNYGQYDSGFLTGLLLGHFGSSASSNAAWMYAHQTDSWYPQWRADMDRQAAQNEKLKAKLDEMDAEVRKLKAQGVQPNPNAELPADVPSSLAIAPEAMIADDVTDNTEQSSDGPGFLHYFLNVLIGLGLIIGAIITYFWWVGAKSRTSY